MRPAAATASLARALAAIPLEVLASAPHGPTYVFDVFRSFFRVLPIVLAAPSPLPAPEKGFPWDRKLGETASAAAFTRHGGHSGENGR